MGVSDIIRSKWAQGATGARKYFYVDKRYSVQLFTAATSTQVRGETIVWFTCRCYGNNKCILHLLHNNSNKCEHWNLINVTLCRIRKQTDTADLSMHGNLLLAVKRAATKTMDIPCENH